MLKLRDLNVPELEEWPPSLGNETVSLIQSIETFCKSAESNPVQMVADSVELLQQVGRYLGHPVFASEVPAIMEVARANVEYVRCQAMDLQKAHAPDPLACPMKTVAIRSLTKLLSEFNSRRFDLCGLILAKQMWIERCQRRVTESVN